MRAYKYTHEYHFTLADKNGRLLRGKQKTLCLCNKTILGKTKNLKQCPHSTEAVGIALWPPYSLGSQISWNGQTRTHTHTHTHTLTHTLTLIIYSRKL